MSRLRFTITLPHDLTDVAGTAQLIERVGFAAANVYDHPCPPKEWLERGGHDAADPFVHLAFAAAATERLLLMTNILVPAYRHPVLTAHAAATLDALSGGRLVLGVGVGYLEAEFERLGVDFSRRGALLDEAVAAMKEAWASVVWPTPTQSPHPPIWMGGNAAAARRRVVKSGSGWMPFPAKAATAAAVRTAAMPDIATLEAAIRQLHADAEAAGRTDRIDVCATPFTHDAWKRTLATGPLLEELTSLEAIGVTWISVQLQAPTLPAYLEEVERFGEEVIRPTLA